MTPAETFAVCGFYLQPGQFSTQNFETLSNGGQLFALLKPVFYLSKDGRLFKLPHGAQSDGISAPAICAAVGREHGGNDWAAGWLHDCAYRFSLMIWNGNQWVKWDSSQGRSKPASDALLHESALACGDSEAMAQTLYWAVVEFGKRSYQLGA